VQNARISSKPRASSASRAKHQNQYSDASAKYATMTTLESAERCLRGEANTASRKTSHPPEPPSAAPGASAE
jgi:hypothetical protein